MIPLALLFFFISSSPFLPSPLHSWLTLVIAKNVDDVSERISSLGIAAATQNSQSIPLTVEAHPPTSLGENQHPAGAGATFLALPWLVKWHIYTHLHSKDCIALSSTCRQMYSFNTFAYTHLQFLPPNSLFSLARSVYLLATVLACSPHYAQAVRTLRIVGWNAINVPSGTNLGMAYNALDEGVTTILKNSPNVHSLTLDLNLTKTIHCFPRTFAALTRVHSVRNLCLEMFLVPMCLDENDTVQKRTPDQAPPAYERVTLRVCNGARLPVMMQDPRNLRWFMFTVLDKSGNPGDNIWAITLQRVTEAATELETLVLGNKQHFDPNTLGQMLRSGFVRVCI